MGVDNTAAISICENPGITARNKHFDDQIHYIRHDYDHQRVRMIYVPTDRQRADGFTKPLDPTTFFRWRENVVPANPILRKWVQFRVVAIPSEPDLNSSAF